jgi:hypothetical protein
MSFRRGDFQVLVATKIAARGLDVNHITHVISFDVPAVPDDYIHRIGCTARMEAEGDAFVLVAPTEEASLARDRAPNGGASHGAMGTLRPPRPGGISLPMRLVNLPALSSMSMPSHV